MGRTRFTGKQMSAAEAVERFVPSGAQVALGGFTVNRNPMALTAEIIRQKKTGLYVVCHSHGQAMDLLIGAGCVSHLEIAYGGIGRFAPTCIRFRKAVQEGSLKVEDYSNFQMSLRFLAGAMGLPFIPAKSGLETDLLARQGFSAQDREGMAKAPPRKLAVMNNPFSAERDQVVLLPALNPDVALVHAQYVGDDGTVRIKGLTFADLEQARSADRVIVSCEKIVPAQDLRRDPDQNSLPSFLVDAVVHCPNGAHPTACHRFYDYDPGHLNMYRALAPNDKGFTAYMRDWVLGPGNWEAYLAKVGKDRLTKIKADPELGYAPGLDRR